MLKGIEQKPALDWVVEVVRDSGGRVVGRTRLQKIAYLFEITGLGAGLEFSYKHYGPYSEDLALASRDAQALGLLTEDEHLASWGGKYSIFSLTDSSAEPNPARRKLGEISTSANAIELELAATAAYLAEIGIQDPWEETQRRKPEKSEHGRLDNAKSLYQRLMAVDTPRRLPAIV